VSLLTACSPPFVHAAFCERRDMPSQSKRVLVVDNNDEESRVLASMLEDAGYRPTTTWSGLEALELLKSREFDIVLVSSYLPDLYVGDFFERFNRLPVQPCVIVMQEGRACADTLMKIKGTIGEENHSEE
jgi:CheY-like chemotaxis protein